MRDHIRFQLEREFVGTEEGGEAGVLSVEGAGWFPRLLGRIRDIDVSTDLLQEDWGVVAFARRAGKRFWIGLSSEGDGEWLAHAHHGALLQRLSRRGREALLRLIGDLYAVLSSDTQVSNVLLVDPDDVA